MPDPIDNVVPFPGARFTRPAEEASLSLTPDASAVLFEPEPAKPRARKKTPSARQSRSKPRPVPQHSPEHKRALEITAIYQMTQPVCDEAKATFAIRTAILCGQWPDEDIVAAVQRVADAGFPLTSNSLSYQLQKRTPGEREVDPVIHQAVDAALEHLGRLDSETMSETEQVLAAALRQICIAVMRKAANEA